MIYLFSLWRALERAALRFLFWVNGDYYISPDEVEVSEIKKIVEGLVRATVIHKPTGTVETGYDLDAAGAIEKAKSMLRHTIKNQWGKGQ